MYADTIRRHDYGHSKVGDELLANARLIAAAPDLLESVRDMVTILSQIQNLLTGYLVPDSLEDQDDCINGILSIADHKETLQKQRKALKAIAKAEGKETT
ncbi:MAG: hypothetical protein MRJ68_19370 [Nitrospira sp.]|nr:hypothetical protein [Nitrospira sp.]